MASKLSGHTTWRWLLCLAALSLGCAPTIRVTADESTDFTAYRTWGWRLLHRDGSETDPDRLALALSVADQIARAMAERGLAFSTDDPDLLVAPELAIRRQRVIVHRAVPDQLLSSHHASPSYRIEGLTVEETQIVEAADLRIEVRDRVRDRVVWYGRMRGRFGGSFSDHAAENTAALMLPFPRQLVPGDAPPPGARALARAQIEIEQEAN